MIKSKKQMFLVIVSFILVMILGVVSYAFFNYTRTGSTNTVSVGRLNFTSTQNNTINLSNVFPTDSTHLDNTNSSTVTINITGDTNYDKGIEYKVSIVDVDNVVNNKEVPIGYSVIASNLGTKSSDYYNERGSTTNVYNLRESGIAEEGQDILIGYIKPDENGVNGSINITAFIDKNEVGISDTVTRLENNNLVYGETDGEWIEGRTILTTTEWNGLATNGISFKIKVEANEGLWVNEPNHIVLKNLNDIEDWQTIKTNVTSVVFHKDGVIPLNVINTIDATDLTSEGPVTIYTVDDGLGNNTYKAIIVASDDIYAPEYSGYLFSNVSKMRTIDATNLKVDNVTNMNRMFGGCTNLINIDSLSKWNTSKVEEMRIMFLQCSSLDNINGAFNWDTSNVTNMYRMFKDCTNLRDVSGLKKWNVSKVTNMDWMFVQCVNLEVIDLSEWETDSLTNMQSMFGMWNSNLSPRLDSKLKRVIVSNKFDTSKVKDMDSLFANNTRLEDLSTINNLDVSSVENMANMFTNCSSLESINIANWNVSKVQSMANMFNYCTKLVSIDLSSWNMSNVSNNSTMFQNTGFKTLAMSNNYTRIDSYMFNRNEFYSNSSFSIPNTVTYIGNSHVFYYFGLSDVFNKFIVESGNTSFKTIDDILYTYDGTRLISVPRGKTFVNNKFEIPEGVTFLNELSFSRNQNIDTLVLPNSYVIERYIDENNNSYGFINSGNSLSVAVYAYTSIKEYEVKNDNTRYSSYGGCIYSKDGSELIAIPLHYTGVLNIKAGTTTIGQEAFWTDEDARSYVDMLTQINIPSSVTTIEANQLTTLNALMSRSTNPVTITIDSGNTAYQIVNNQIVAR